MQLPAIIGLHRSRILGGFLALTAALAAAAALAFPAPVLFRLVILAAVLGIAWRARGRLAPPLSALRLELDGEISVIGPGQQEFAPARLLPGATVHPWLTVLRLEIGEAPAKTLMVTVDSLEADDFRRLRSFLRWRAQFSDEGGDA